MEPRSKVNHWPIALDKLDSLRKGYENSDKPASSAPPIPMTLGKDPGPVVTSASKRVTPAEVRQRRQLARATAAAPETGSVSSSAVLKPETPISKAASIRAECIASRAKGKAPATPTSGDNAAIPGADSSKEERPVQVGGEKNSELKRLNQRQVSSSENKRAIRAQLDKEMENVKNVIQEMMNTAVQTYSSIPQHLEETPVEQMQSCIKRVDALQRYMDLEQGSMALMRARILLISQCLDEMSTHADNTDLHTDKMQEFILYSTDVIHKRLDAADERAVRYDGLLELLNKQINPLRELIECLTESHFSVLRQVDLINQKLTQLGNSPPQEGKEPQEQDGGDVECDTGARNMDSDTSDFVVVSDDESLFGDLFS